MPHCTKCGALVAETSAYCPKCGQAQTGAAPQTGAGTHSGLSENAAGLLCYLVGWITGIIFFVIDKRPYVRFHAAQSLVVFGGLHILRIIFGMAFGLGWMMGWPMGMGRLSLGFGLISLLGLITFILWILLMIKAYQGERFRVPVAADLADSLAGK